jgi:imidazolonepropionase-like amidohydrolase
VTETPGRVFGHPNIGVIRDGALANLVLWGGDPFEPASAVEAIWIDGRSISLRSRQTELFDRYRTLPGTPVPALDLP